MIYSFADMFVVVVASISLGIALTLYWYFNLRRKPKLFAVKIVLSKGDIWVVRYVRKDYAEYVQNRLLWRGLTRLPVEFYDQLGNFHRIHSKDILSVKVVEE